MKELSTEHLDRLLDSVLKPSRYIGGEMNAVSKPFDQAELTFAFCFPDSYEVGMSHLGIKILYDIINKQPWALCERAFMPWPDMADGLRRENLPLFFFTLAGGLLYTIGIIPFALKKKGAHFIWHFFVLFGSITHWFGIYLYIYG